MASFGHTPGQISVKELLCCGGDFKVVEQKWPNSSYPTLECQVFEVEEGLLMAVDRPWNIFSKLIKIRRDNDSKKGKAKKEI